MIFNTLNTVYGPMDREYHESAPRENQTEEPILSVGELGETVHEQPGQSDLIMNAKAALKRGSAKIELQPAMGGPGSPGGAEGYGAEARAALREMAKAAEIEFTAVHVPVQINGLSGYSQQHGRFVDDVRKSATNEINSCVRFSAETAGGGAIVVHASEFDRPVSEADWNEPTVLEDGSRRYDFMSNVEEADRAVKGVVDQKDGRVITLAQKNIKITRPVWKRAKEDHIATDPYTGKKYEVKQGQYLNEDGLPTEDLGERVPEYESTGAGEPTKFKTETIGWEDIEREAKEMGLDPAVHFYKQHMEKQIAQQLGMVQYYAQGYESGLRRREKIKHAIQYYQKLYDSLPDDEKWKIEQHVRMDSYGLVPPDTKDPVTYLKEELVEVERRLKHTHESSASAKAQAEQQLEDLNNIVSIDNYALQQTHKTLAEAGVSAWEQSKNNPHANRDIFIAVENWDPNSYGNHPDEMIDMITSGRQKMVDYLTEKHIQNTATGEKVQNPYYQPGMSKKEAEKLAEQHLKMTLDTEHLALWRKKFMPRPGESREDTNKRFQKWYEKQLDKLVDSGIVGHIHMVDSIEGGHTHLPAGEGELPLKKVVKKLKEAGYTGRISSEAHGENLRYGKDRIVTKPWKYFGGHMYSRMPGAPGPNSWGQAVGHFYGRNEPPMYIVGAYVPSNEWQLWSQVPLE